MAGGTRAAFLAFYSTQTDNTYLSGVARLWVKTSNGHLIYTNASNSDTDLSAGGGASTGNWTFSGNNADLTAAGTLGIALTTATAISLGQSTSLASGKALSSAGGVANFDWSSSSGTFKTSTGVHTFGGSAYNFPAASTIQSTAQGATNTIGLSLAPNVADGASSIGVVINNATATPSGKIVSFQEVGGERSNIRYDGTFNYFQGKTTNTKFIGAAGTGFADQSGTLYFYINGAADFQMTANDMSPLSASLPSIGSATPFTAIYNKFYSAQSATIPTLASGATITPTQFVHKVSGTTTVSTIATTNLPTGFIGPIALICTGAVPFTTGGNIASTGFTATANQTYVFWYDGTNFYRQ